MATAHGKVMGFGPEGDQWIYYPKQQLYDLTRSRTPAEGAALAAAAVAEGGTDAAVVPTSAVTVRVTAGPLGTRIAVAPERTALVIVDMQNFFLHRRCRDHPTGRAAVAPTLAAIAQCRRAGIQIVWLNWGLADADLAAMPASVSRSFAQRMIDGATADGGQGALVPSGLGVDMGTGRGRALAKGSWNAAIYEGEAGTAGCGAVESLAAAVQPDDVHCDKTRISGMWAPTEKLRRYLAGEDAEDAEDTEDAEAGSGGDGRRIRTLLFAGVNTDQCVLGTLVDAYNGGWDCVAVADCCATTTPGGQAMTMDDVAVRSVLSPAPDFLFFLLFYTLCSFSLPCVSAPSLRRYLVILTLPGAAWLCHRQPCARRGRAEVQYGGREGCQGEVTMTRPRGDGLLKKAPVGI